MQAISLFSGVGGWEFGLPHAEFVLAVDSDPHAADIYQRNHKTPIHLGSVADINYSCYADIDLVTASPPCQDYSGANRQNACQDSDRAGIGFILIRVLVESRPSTLILENVPQYRSGIVYRILKEAGKNLGYSVHEAIVDAANYGVPQNRKRFFAVFTRNPYFYFFPPPTHSPTPTFFHARWRSWYEAIKNIPLPPVTLSNREWEKYGAFLQDTPIALLDHDGASKTAKPRPHSQPSKTVRALGTGRHCWQFTAYIRGQSYRLNAQALSRLQSFPPTLALTGNELQDIKRIGNAVPPLLIAQLFSGILCQKSNGPTFPAIRELR